MHCGHKGIGYSETELLTWTSHIDSFLAQGVDVYVYFNNDPDGYAIRDAQHLHELLQAD